MERKEKQLEERVSKIEEIKKLAEFEQKAVEFCTEKLRQGYTQEDILEVAIRAEWKEDEIRKILKLIK